MLAFWIDRLALAKHLERKVDKCELAVRFQVGSVVAAATATRDLPDGRDGVIAASVLQASSLAALADRTAIVVSAQRDIFD